MTTTNKKAISKAIAADEKDEWNRAEDQHQLTERQVDTEMAANKKAAQATKTDPKSQESKGTPT